MERMDERIQSHSEPQEHAEGRVARAIEQQTAKLPSDAFLWAAFGAMATAAILQISDRRNASLFVGQWAAPLLLFGIYNKLVKIAGSDRTSGEGIRAGGGNGGLPGAF